MRYLTMLFMLIGLAGHVRADETLEYKIAVIDAGKYVLPTDSSISRAKTLVTGLATCYQVPPQKAADMSVKARRMAKERSALLSLLDIMDAALIACDEKGNAQALAEALAQYVTVREASGQTHQQAVHGLLILNYIAKVSAKK